MQEKLNIRKLYTIMACVVVQICVGILYLWSIFKTPVVSYYAWSEKAATMVSPLMLLGFVLGNLIGGYLQDKSNPRLIATIGAAMFSAGIFLTSLLTNSSIWLIFVTYCMIGGLGCGFTYASILSCLQKWFPSRRGFASGIAVASFAASTVLFGPISQTLLSSFKERNVPYTFLTLSIVFFILSMIACIFIRLPKAVEDLSVSSVHDVTKGDSSDCNNLTKSDSTANMNTVNLEERNLVLSNSVGENSKSLNVEDTILSKSCNRIQKNYTPLEAMKTLPFWCITLTLFFINGTWNMVVPMIKDLGITRGLSETAAVAAVTITGVTNTLGRFAMASVSDKIGRELTVILLALATAVVALLLIFAGSYFYLVIIAMLAFCYGGPSSTLPAMTTDLYGTKYGGTNYGIAMLGLGVSSIVFNFLSIMIDNQTATFVMGAVSALMATFLMIVCLRISKRHKSKQ